MTSESPLLEQSGDAAAEPPGDASAAGPSPVGASPGDPSKGDPSKGPAPPTTRRRSTAERIAWITAIGLMVAALARIIVHDRWLLLVWVNSFTLYVYLPAYVVLAWALYTGRRRLAVTAGIVIACHLAWVLPDFRPASAPPAAMEAATGAVPRLRIFSANVYGRNRAYAELVAEICAARPDVILLQEYSPAWGDAMQTAGITADYPHRFELPHPGSFGLAVYARSPIANKTLWDIKGIALTRVTIDLAGTPLRIYNVHSHPPRNTQGLNMWNAYLEKLAVELSAETGPFVAVGDFNLTQHARAYRRLLNLGLATAHVQRGRGWAVTWPNGKSAIMPPIRIDHAFLAPRVRCVSIEEGIGVGSDHKPLILELAVLGASS